MTLIVSLLMLLTAHAAAVTIVGEVQRQAEGEGGAEQMTDWLWPRNPEDAWTVLKTADHPSRVPAIPLDGYTGPERELVAVTGDVANGRLRVTNVRVQVTTMRGLILQAPPFNTGAHRTLLITAGWADRPFPVTLTPDAILASMRAIATPDLLANLSQRATFAYEITDAGVLSGVSHCRLGDAVREATDIVDPRIDFSRFDSIALIAPSFCFAGVAMVHHITWRTADDGTTSPQRGIRWNAPGTAENLAQTEVHEFGHNADSHHCKLDTCHNAPAGPLEARCVSEYGNSLCSMGGAVWRCEWSSTAKLATDAILPSEVLTVTTSGTYTVAPIESDASTPKLIKIPRGADDSTALFLERRQLAGRCLQWAAARQPPSEFTDGKGWLISVPDGRGSAGDVTGGPIQIDPVGPPSSWNGALRPEHGWWTDTTSGIRVRVVNDGASVEVAFGTGSTTTTTSTTASTSSTSQPPTSSTSSSTSTTSTTRVTTSSTSSTTRATTTTSSSTRPSTTSTTLVCLPTPEVCRLADQVTGNPKRCCAGLTCERRFKGAKRRRCLP